MSPDSGTPSPVMTQLGMDKATVLGLVPRSSLGREVIGKWLEDFERDFPDATPREIPAPEKTRVSQEGFAGWKPQAPPPGYRTPPIPVGLLLPKGELTCGIDALDPWWNELAIRPSEAATEIHFAGNHMRTGDFGGIFNSWALDSNTGTAHLDVYADGHLDAWIQLAIKRDGAVKRTGVVGSLIPGYSELKNGVAVVSEVSASTDYYEFGCRVDFGVVTAVTVRADFSTVKPLFGKYKKLVKSRGYSMCGSLTVGIELSDGWRPLRIEVSRGQVPLEHETDAFQFAGALVKRVTEHRSRAPWLSADNSSVAAIQLDYNSAHSTREKNQITYQWRCELPGARPLSTQHS